MSLKIKVEKKIQLTGHRGAIYTLAAKGDRHFLSGGGDGWLVEWNLDDPDPGRVIAKVDSNIFSLAVINQQQLGVGNMNGGLHWVDLKTISNPGNIAAHKKGIFDLFKLDNYLLSLGGSGTISRWSIETGRTLESYQISHESLRAASYCKQRNELAVACSDNNIYFLDIESLNIKRVIYDAHENSVFSVCYTSDGQHLLSGGRDAHLKAWDLDHEFECIFDVPAHWYTLNHIALQPGGRLFATASRDRSIKIWDAASFDLIKVIDRTKLDGHLNSVNKLLWMEDGKTLISCSDDRTVIIWGIEII